MLTTRHEVASTRHPKKAGEAAASGLRHSDRYCHARSLVCRLRYPKLPPESRLLVIMMDGAQMKTP
jgi:hypothetical protein